MQRRYEMWPNYLKLYGSLPLHKISTTGEITKKRRETCHSCSWHTYRSSSVFLPHISNNKEAVEPKGLWLWNAFRGNKKNEQSKSCLFCMQHFCLTLYMFLSIIIKLAQTVWSYGLHKILTSEEIARKPKEQKLSFLYAILLLDLIYNPTKNYQVISNSKEVMACTRFRLHGT